jgi:PAS domain S-box-containing protein
MNKSFDSKRLAIRSKAEKEWLCFSELKQDNRQMLYEQELPHSEIEVSTHVILELLQARENEDFSRTVLRLLYELHVHQIELETQNAALRQAKLALEHSRNSYVALYEFAPVAYLTLTEQGVIEEVNQTGATLLGAEPHELQQWRFAGLVNPTDSERWQHFFAQLLQSRQRQTINLALNSSNGNLLYAQLDCLPVLVEHNRSALRVALTDMTAHKQAEMVLIQARDLAEKANRAKSDFLSSMSHELRTPMNAVLGFAQLLESEDLTADQHDSVKEILTAGYHLLELINQVIDLSKIESEKIEIGREKIDLADLVQHCMMLIEPLTVKNAITIVNNISTTTHFTVLADSLRLKQVLLNLTSNAIKYNQVGGSVTLSAELGKPQTVRIKVIDTGKGLSKLQLAKLFQPFERLGAKNSNIEGTGIGLCISKKLIEAMGGAIGVESAEGQGCCFWIEVPLV